jgi:NADP-dependent 3-hydroxy acid dehydrogenase YdfG
VSDYAQAETMARRAEETFGGVDVLVNAAGIMLPAPIAGADPADWRRMVEVNLLGVLYATRAVLPGMLERGEGHIVNVSSTSGRVASPLFSVYAATKFGLGAFTEVLRKEVHRRLVRVTLFEPGPTRSELGSHVDPEIMESLREDSFGEVEFLGAEDVAQGTLWALAQPERINVNEVLFRPPTSETGDCRQPCELLRTPSPRSSENAPDSKLGGTAFTLTLRPAPGQPKRIAVPRKCTRKFVAFEYYVMALM